MSAFRRSQSVRQPKLHGLGEGSAGVANAGYEALVATRFSRDDESEADRIGLELAARAGYDPRAGVTLWRKMINASQGGRPPEFLSSHPAEASRVQQIQALLPAVMPLYDAALRCRAAARMTARIACPYVRQRTAHP